MKRQHREGTHRQETFRGTRTLRFLCYEPRGRSTTCNTKITRLTGWRLHHCVPRGMGGSRSAENRGLLHPECHDWVHRQRFRTRNRVSPKEAFEGLDLCGRKLSCTVLRGLEGSNPVRLLGHPPNMQGTDLTSVGLHGPIVDPHKAETVFQTRSFVPVVCSMGQMKTNFW
jgi:hypothetical protein